MASQKKFKKSHEKFGLVVDDESLQMGALKGFGCEKIFSDKVSGANADRPGLVDALKYTREGDYLVVWRLDRLG